MKEPAQDKVNITNQNQRSRTLKTQAIVLRSFDDGEADRTIIVLTPELGKLKARVRGARRITSRLGGHTDILNLSLLNIALGNKSNIVTGAESIKSFIMLKSSLEHLATGIYLSELCSALIPEEISHIGVYNLLLQAIEALNSHQGPQIVARCLELKVLAETGYRQELYLCVSCGSNIEPNQHSYAPSQGGVLCSNCTGIQESTLPLSLNSLKVLRYFDRMELRQILTIKLDANVESEIEKLLDQSIAWILERQSRARKFVDHLHSLKQSQA